MTQISARDAATNQAARTPPNVFQPATASGLARMNQADGVVRRDNAMLRRTARRRRAQAIALVASATAAASALSVSAAHAATAPQLDVVARGVPAEAASRLATALSLDRIERGSDGSLRMVDDARYARVPTTPVPGSAGRDEDGRATTEEVFDMDALRGMRALPNDEASRRVNEALAAAGLSSLGEFDVQHSTLQLFNRAGAETLRTAVDTEVELRQAVDGIPIVGSGQEAGITFAPDGQVTRVAIATRSTKRGRSVTLLAGDEADAIARAQYLTTCGRSAFRSLRLERKLVYFAPSLGFATADRLLPHYQYEAKTVIAGQVVNLNGIVIPATRTGVPRVTLRASADGATVRGSVSVQGGVKPYRVSYDACSGNIASTGTNFRFVSRSRDGGRLDERVSVRIVDANGITATASDTVHIARSEVSAAPSARAAAADDGRSDYGVEYIGMQQGLPHAKENADEFSDEMSDVAHREFIFADSKVYDTDFTDSALDPNGRDSLYADDVDLMFFEAHGWPGGFITGNANSNGIYKSVTSDEVRWGNRDLEWIAALSCQLLAFKDKSGQGLDKRWVKALRGLHMQLGFQTDAYDNSAFGDEFGDNIADDDMSVKNAWWDAADAHQPAGVIFAAIGPIGTGGKTNISDHAFGLGGGMTADIGTLSGYWLYNGVS